MRGALRLLTISLWRLLELIDMENNEEDEKRSEDPPKFLNDTEVFKINGKDWLLPDQPVASFTKAREDDLRNDISVSTQYDRFSNVEDVAVSILDGRANTENQIEKVIEAESTDADIYDDLGFKEVSDSSKDISVTRHVVPKSYLNQLDEETMIQLASIAEEVGDVYVMPPLTADETGMIDSSSVEDYLEIAKTLRKETESMTIVPVLHLTKAEGEAPSIYASKVDQMLSTADYPFIGITGNNPFSNRKAFDLVREMSEKKLLVSQCPKKLTGSDLEGLRPVSRAHFYIAKEAKVVLDKKHLPGGGGSDEQRLELVQDSYSVFGKTSCENAESAIPEFVAFEAQRDEIEESSSTKDFELLHNEIAISEGVKDIRDKLDQEVSVLEDKESLLEAVERFNS
jgi:hypothetical protein